MCTSAWHTSLAQKQGYFRAIWVGQKQILQKIKRFDKGREAGIPRNGCPPPPQKKKKQQKNPHQFAESWYKHFKTARCCIGINAVGWLCWGLTSQSTIFQSYWDGAIASWVINQYFRGVKCLAQGHNTAAVGLEPRSPTLYHWATALPLVSMRLLAMPNNGCEQQKGQSCLLIWDIVADTAFVSPTSILLIYDY